jgi:signal transduction histidine kinase
MSSHVRVLIVDDEPSVLFTLQAILEREGYQVATARTATEAEALLERQAFDVALLDLRLEEADGIELLERLIARQPDCMAIMLTGYASLQSAIRAIRQGAYDYLIKPCNVDELKLTIARAAERGALSRALRERLAELEEANAKVRSLADQLQERVDQKTAELNQKVTELAEAKRRLEEAQQERERFISMIAHELSQPLTTISGYLQLLERKASSDESQRRAIATISTQTRRLARLVRDLADASRLSAGQFEVQRAPCDLVEVVREQVDLAPIHAEGRPVQLELPPGPIPASCDRDRIGQVVLNLLDNAIKHGTGTIHVRLAQEGDRAVLTVSDEGPGIPPDRITRIFEPYVRLSEGNGTPRGTGLGLYITRGIVEAHGGTIAVQSAPGQGTTFVVRLPVTSPAALASRVGETIER